MMGNMGSNLRLTLWQGQCWSMIWMQQEHSPLDNYLSNLDKFSLVLDN